MARLCRTCDHDLDCDCAGTESTSVTAPVEVINERVKDFDAIIGYVVRTTTVLTDGSVMVELQSLTARGRDRTQDRKTVILTGWRWFDK